MNFDKDIATELKQRLIEKGFKGNLVPDAPIAPMTFYNIGGPASLLADAIDISDLQLLYQLLKEHPLPCIVIGAGSNLLVSDDGYPGVILRLSHDFSQINVDEDRTTINVGAAIPLVKLIREAYSIGLGGIERLAGIPGLVGGAIFMNAGTFGQNISDLIQSVDILEIEGQVKSLEPEACDFAYRSSRFQKSREIILRCTITGKKTDPGDLSSEIDRRLERRKLTQPVDVPSCGCVFKNPSVEHSAGNLIEQAGLKGHRVGDAVISDLHANFIINDGLAPASDILSLMAFVRKKVREKTGMLLIPEVQAVGFSQPLEVILDSLETDKN